MGAATTGPTHVQSDGDRRADPEGAWQSERCLGGSLRVRLQDSASVVAWNDLSPLKPI